MRSALRSARCSARTLVLTSMHLSKISERYVVAASQCSDANVNTQCVRPRETRVLRKKGARNGVAVYWWIPAKHHGAMTEMGRCLSALSHLRASTNARVLSVTEHARIPARPAQTQTHL